MPLDIVTKPAFKIQSERIFFKLQGKWNRDKHNYFEKPCASYIQKCGAYTLNGNLAAIVAWSNEGHTNELTRCTKMHEISCQSYRVRNDRNASIFSWYKLNIPRNNIWPISSRMKLHAVDFLLHFDLSDRLLRLVLIAVKYCG